MGSDTSSAPAGRWVLYASTPVATTHQSSASISAALKDTRAALEQLVQLPPSNPDTAPDPTTPDQGGDSTEAAVDSEASAAEQKGRPKALLLVSYLQCTLGLQQVTLCSLPSSCLVGVAHQLQVPTSSSCTLPISLPDKH